MTNQLVPINYQGRGFFIIEVKLIIKAYLTNSGKFSKITFPIFGDSFLFPALVFIFDNTPLGIPVHVIFSNKQPRYRLSP